MKILQSYLTLCRVNIALFAACSAATGFFLGPWHQPVDVLVLTIAVFLIACGASAMNQVQERGLDAKMERTRLRPLPTHAITPPRALSTSVVLIASGFLALMFSAGPVAASLGLSAVLWYNVLYTYLKRRTAFASVPGAVVGMIPPALGWIAAGGDLLDMRLVAGCFVFFLWQVPHFWLLLLNHGEEYEKAGLPSLTGVLSTKQIARIIFVWICAAATAGPLLPLFGTVRSPLICFSLIPPAAWLVWKARTLLTRHPVFSAPALFRSINAYIFLVMSLLSLEGILFRAP